VRAGMATVAQVSRVAAVGTHPTARLDDVVHQRSRLGILSVLQVIHKVEFTTLRDELGLTDGNCNRHLLALSEAGLIALSKARGTGRVRTWVRITADGRRALQAEVAALQELIAGLQS
jgi:DNA-binding MarR family transcriptional regulator